MGALLGTRSCGRCGAATSEGQSWCQKCGVRLVPAMSGSAIGTYSGLLIGVQTATPAKRRIALAIDSVPVLVLGAVIFLAVVRPSDDGVGVVVGLGGILLLALYCALHTVLVALIGRSLGRWILALRTVDDLTGEPRGLVDRVGGVRSMRRNTVTVDLRRGRDPLRMPQQSPPRSLQIAAIGVVSRGQAVGSASEAPAVFESSPSSPAVALVLDSGERLEIDSSVLIGRAPVNRDDEEYPLFAWPDLGRSLAKTHALLEWSGTVLWVTDMSSTTGSSLVGPDGTLQPLVPGLRGPAAPGYTVRLGQRALEVHPSGIVESRTSNA